MNKLHLMKQLHKSTEGEKILEYYFEEQNIKFEREVKLVNLEHDTKSYRVADFYLPKFKVYVEFLGRWGIEDSKEDYRRKIEVYKDNNVPCVYIYPENLGILHTIFKMRLEKLLMENPKLKSQLFSFLLWKFKKVLWLGVGIFFGFSVISIIWENILSGQLRVSILSLIIPTIFLIVLILYGAKYIFQKK